MTPQETNALLRKMVNDLIILGRIKTNIGKALLGDNGQGHVNHWLSINSNGKTNDFGIKPLNNIADQIKYELHTVFLPKEGDDEIKKILDEYNIKFTEKLKNAINAYLTEKTPKPSYIHKNKTKIDLAIDEMLNIIDKNPQSNNSVIDQYDLAPEEME